MTDTPLQALAQFSDALAALAATANRNLTAITLPHHRPLSAILWRPGVAVTSEQVLADGADYQAVLPGGKTVAAKLAGRDPGTNVAAFTFDHDAAPLPRAGDLAVGALAVLLGADGAGRPNARFGMIRHLGPAWQSLAGGKIDRLIVLDARLRPDTEGGPVLDARGGLIGLSTSGPHRKALVIPASTIDRVLDPLLKDGRIARGWLGVGVQPVRLPDTLHDAAGRDAGLMIASLAKNGPAEQAGLLPGDIVLTLDGQDAIHARGIARMLGPDRVGKPLPLRILRAGTAKDVSVTVGARP
ncbi:MAG TPA: S1C family serine protease [Magnetospirillaceae bacterium]|jgi:S1-C subfamily serine protease